MAMIPNFFGNRRSNSIFDPFSMDLWDPFKDLDFPTPTSFPQLSRENSAFVNTRVDWKETPNAHVFKADLPGLKKEEVKVEIEDDRVLQISGERHVEKEEKKDTWHRMERSSGKFSRRFRLPEDVKMEDVKASMENGVLTVTVPKLEKKKAETRSVEISDIRQYICSSTLAFAFAQHNLLSSVKHTELFGGGVLKVRSDPNQIAYFNTQQSTTTTI
ncbi:hypothetical protein GQ457_16G011100 [Hibiscus cannabinus]